MVILINEMPDDHQAFWPLYHMKNKNTRSQKGCFHYMRGINRISFGRRSIVD
jgi:hypothetical protein